MDYDLAVKLVGISRVVWHCYTVESARHRLFELCTCSFLTRRTASSTVEFAGPPCAPPTALTEVSHMIRMKTIVFIRGLVDHRCAVWAA